MTRVALVPLLGMPGSGKTTLAARLVEVATRGAAGGGRLALLPELASELELRGIRREEADARPGGRTTRQVLDAVLRDGTLSEGASEDETLYVEPLSSGGRVLGLVDTSGRRFENDALAQDPLHPHRALGREAAAVVLVLEAAAWAGERGPRESERDRAEALLRRLSAARAERGGGRLPVAVVAARLDAALGLEVPVAVRRLASEAASHATLEVATFAVAREDEDALRALLLWLLPRAAPPTSSTLRRRALRVAAGALAAAFVVWAAGLLSVLSIARAPRLAATQGLSASAAERAFLEGSQGTLDAWSFLPLPKGGVGESLARHAGYLEEALRRDHPALLEPGPAVELAPAQYRNAAEGLALVAGFLSLSEERRALVQRMKAKARVAEMPLAARETLPAWEELWRTTGDPVVREGVIAPRLRPIYAAIVAEASRESQAVTGYPDLLLPLVRREAAHAPIARDLFRAAIERQWERAVEAVYARLHAPGQDDVATLLNALESAPEPPPDAALERIGRWLAEAVVAAPTSSTAGISARIERLLGTPGARGLRAAVPALYKEMAASPADTGPTRLAGLRALLSIAPSARFDAAQLARQDALAAHLEALTRDGAYSLHVKHALVSDDFGTFLNPFDMTIAVMAERAKERAIGPMSRCRELRPANALFGPGELPWRAWEKVEVRVTDAGVPVGIFRRGPGACFGLFDLDGEWIDPAARGRMTIEIVPTPPRPFDFTGW